MQINRLLQNIATLGFVGYLPYAPGTWASLAGLAIAYFMRPTEMQLFLMIIASVIIGIPAAAAAEKAFGQKDSGRIVIDELAGFFVAIALLPRTPGNLIAAFLLFRVFDIVKPFPIRLIERRLPGGIGVVADDIAAGIYANIILQAWNRISGSL